MTSPASAASKEERPCAPLTLESITAPIAEDLRLTQILYEETILATAERRYIQALLGGEGGAYIPEAFRVETADQIARHLLRGEGKWIRAVVCLLGAKACGASGPAVRQVAVAVEVVHLATLVHDDVIDQAPIRRGIQSVSDGWGNSVSVLLGDFLFSKAFKLLLASGSVAAQTLLTVATGQMCLGEIKQLCYATDAEFKERDYLEMIENKTASLMAAASAAGGHFSGLPDEITEKVHGYGHALGMAFQITDDVLDYTASSSILGKERCGDLRNGKVTLPLIHLYEHNPAARAIVENNLPMEEKSQQLLEWMSEVGSIDYAYSVGRRYGDRAKAFLDEIKMEIGDSESLASLVHLVDFILNRNR